MTDLPAAWHQAAPHTCDDARRRLQQRIRVAWREERERGAYNPSDELALDLDALTDDELVALHNVVRERVALADTHETPSDGNGCAAPAKPATLLPKEEALVAEALDLVEQGASTAKVEAILRKVTCPELLAWLRSEVRTRRNRDPPGG